MINRLNSIIRLGIKNNFSYQLKRQIYLTNSISLIFAGLFLTFLLIRIIFFGKPIFGSLDYILILLMYISPIILNAFGFTRMSRIISCIIPILIVFYQFIIPLKILTPVEPTMYDGARLYLITCGIIPYLIFDNKNVWLLLLGILPALISILFFDQIMALAGVGYKQLGLPGTDYPVMWLRSVIAYAGISAMCLVLINMVTRNDQANQKLISELTEKSNVIQLQNIELNDTKKKIQDLNNNLEILVEIKTQKIAKQNEVLSNYAFTNAHKLRGPVARVLGLIEISRLTSEIEFQWFVKQMESEVRDIDKIIKEIGNNLNQA